MLFSVPDPSPSPAGASRREANATGRAEKHFKEERERAPQPLFGAEEPLFGAEEPGADDEVRPLPEKEKEELQELFEAAHPEPAQPAASPRAEQAAAPGALFDVEAPGAADEVRPLPEQEKAELQRLHAAAHPDQARPAASRAEQAAAPAALFGAEDPGPADEVRPAVPASPERGAASSSRREAEPAARAVFFHSEEEDEVRPLAGIGAPAHQEFSIQSDGASRLAAEAPGAPAAGGDLAAARALVTQLASEKQALEKEKDQLHAETAELRAQTRALHAEREELNAEIQRLKAVEAQAAALHAEKTQLHAEKQALHEEIERLKAAEAARATAAAVNVA